MKKFFQYIRDAIKELGFVTWPKKDVLIRHSLIVLAVTFIFGGIFWLVDGGLRQGMNQYIASTESFRGTGSTMTGTTMSGTTLPGNIDLGDVQVNGGSVQTIPAN